MRSSYTITMVVFMVVSNATAGPIPFEIAAWVDHYDFAAIEQGGRCRFDTEKPEGVAAILDHVQETGATTILWRNCAGSTMRYQSMEESHHNDSQLDKRRVLDDRAVYGWVRYGEADPDLIRTMVRMCRERGLRPGIHWPFEETHWALFTIGRWNLEHPQFWGRTVDGQPWWGRCSLAFEPVVQHKLRLVDELLDRGVECLFLDFFRTGGWGPHAEYVEPLVRSFRRKYGESPPAEATDPRWVRHVCESVTSFLRRLHDRMKRRNPKFELMVGLPNIAPINDRTMTGSLADWRTWVREGLVDTVVVNNVCWDAKDPMGTTRAQYREVMDFVAGRCKVLLPVCAYNYHERGIPRYQEATGRTQDDLARELATMAWEEGAAGLSLECVDYDNYSQPTRAVLKGLRESKCQFVHQNGTVPPAARQDEQAEPAARAGPSAAPGPARSLSSLLLTVTQLTTGPGNDTEAAWSPDGSRIAFQSDRARSLDLYLLDLKTKRTTPLVSGPGHACFPAWSPDGKQVAYSYANFTKTAVEGIDDGYNLFLKGVGGGGTLRLTTGLYRDYTPTFSRDGKQILFASTRSSKGEEASVGLFGVPVAGGTPEPVLQTAGNDVAAVQPAVSPDGRLLAYGLVAGFRSNWSVRLAKAEDPRDAFPLTDGSAPFYGPRWSPTAPLLACTGYVPGDPGWGLYLVDATTGQRMRLNTGPGNSRSPSWSPNGKELVFENNRSGVYKLYRVSVPPMPKAPAGREESPSAQDDGSAGRPVIEFAFRARPEGKVIDLSNTGNDATVEGEVTWRDGAVDLGPTGFLTIPAPKGCDFGGGAFSVKATVLVREHTNKLRLIALGDYPGNRHGWQLYLADNNQVWFNSRDLQLNFLGAVSDTVLPVGRKVTLIGIRYNTGIVRLFVDGVQQASAASGATFHYPAPLQVRLGALFDGRYTFGGQLYDFAVYPRALTTAEIGQRSLKEFLAR